ncbi:MAG TPA: hypothetical protein VEQ11_01140 [Chloroflexota bacterium]|nr:hypothetical protein [Chloroflexota bacterium]
MRAETESPGDSSSIGQLAPVRLASDRQDRSLAVGPGEEEHYTTLEPLADAVDEPV